MKPLDLTKPLQTRQGEKAELVYDGISGDYPLAVVVHLKGGETDLRTYTREGIHVLDEDSMSNLMNVPEKHTFWMNIYEDRQERYSSRDQADFFAGDGCIACVEVTYTEGKGSDSPDPITSALEAERAGRAGACVVGAK